MANVFVASDPHAPATHPGYLPWCKEICKKYKCDKVVITGDVVDLQAISFHSNNPSCPGALDEFHLAKKEIQKWYRAFPKAIVTIGNHDQRVLRLAESVNIPPQYLRNYAEIWNTPGWKWLPEVIIDKVYYYHGSGRGGADPAFLVMKDMLMSVVMGHCHSAAGIKWLANPLQRTFGMNVGCGIDIDAFQFAYGANCKKRPILAAGVVLNGVPQHFIMPCGKGEKYHKSNFKCGR